MTKPDINTLRMHLVGCAFLLSRIQHHVPEMDRECIHQALRDVVELFPDNFELVRSSIGLCLEMKL